MRWPPARSAEALQTEGRTTYDQGYGLFDTG